MEKYTIITNDIVSFRGTLYSISKYYQGTGRVTLVPVRGAENGRMFIVDGKPRVFRAATVEREASFYQSFRFQSLD